MYGIGFIVVTTLFGVLIDKIWNRLETFSIRLEAEEAENEKGEEKQ